APRAALREVEISPPCGPGSSDRGPEAAATLASCPDAGGSMGLRDRVKAKAKQVLGREPAPGPAAVPRARTEAAVPVPLPPPEPESEAAPRAEVAVPPSAPPAEGPNGAIVELVVAAMHTIYDPEIPVDVYELGLIYDIAVADDGAIDVRMTLTSPNCPAAQSLPAEVREKAAAVPGANGARVEV